MTRAISASRCIRSCGGPPIDAAGVVALARKLARAADAATALDPDRRDAFCGCQPMVRSRANAVGLGRAALHALSRSLQLLRASPPPARLSPLPAARYTHPPFPIPRFPPPPPTHPTPP